MHYIECNTNPSLSYQAPWHEEFVDGMARRMLDIALDGVFPEDKAAVAEAAAAAEASAKLYTPQTPGRWRPAEGWQFLLNMYTASTKHAAQESGWSNKGGGGSASPRHAGGWPTC